MKTTNKFSSFIGGFVIAFAIALFVPTAAQATWGNYSNSNYSSSSNYNVKYKKLAYNNLRYYYSCYNYKYYRAYVYYMKKYKQTCQSKPLPANNCAKYKSAADKYLAAYKRCGYDCYYKYYQYYMKAYKKCQSDINSTGKVCGLVFEDTNENDAYDNSDKHLANVSVKITDAKGKSQTVKTNNKGYYCASNVLTGTATVAIIESTLPANPTLVVGTNTTKVDVKANKKNWEENNGYIFPVPTGSVCGVVYEDVNKNNKQDTNEKGAPAIEVVIIDAAGEIHKVSTDDNGKYCAKNVPIGSAEITVTEATIPNQGQLTAGVNPNSINVEANKENHAGKDGYTLPDPVGNLCGLVYIEDDNGTKNPQENVTVNVIDALGQSQDIITDVNGKWCAKAIAAGTATVDIDENTLPSNAEYISGNGDSSDHKVLPNKDNNAGEDVYVVPTQLGKVCGQVVVDNTGQEGVTLNITDVNGDIILVKTNTDGKWCANNVPVGEVSVDVDESTLPNGVERVLGQDNDTYSIEAGKTTDALIDGYKIQANCVCFRVYEDKNGNGEFDIGEGIGKITATLTDVNGVEHTSETLVDDGDVYFKNLPLGTVTITVDDNDPDMPTNLVRTIGTSTISFDVTKAGQNKAPYHGFTNKLGNNHN